MTAAVKLMAAADDGGSQLIGGDGHPVNRWEWFVEQAHHHGYADPYRYRPLAIDDSDFVEAEYTKNRSAEFTYTNLVNGHTIEFDLNRMRARNTGAGVHSWFALERRWTCDEAMGYRRRGRAKRPTRWEIAAHVKEPEPKAVVDAYVERVMTQTQLPIAYPVGLQPPISSSKCIIL